MMAPSLVLVALFVLLALNVPIAIALALPVVAYFHWFTDLPMMMVGQKLFTNIASVPLMAVPFFILAAALMRTGGVANRLVELGTAMVGQYPGGLAMAGVLACTFFAAISGSSSATVIAIGGIMFPAMRKAGYDQRLALGPITTAGALGILIPPSIPMIIYGFVTETSIPKLFIAGILPGLFLSALLMGTTYAVAVRSGHRSGAPVSLRGKLHALRRSFWSLLLPVIVLVGIYGMPEMTIGGETFGGAGFFTPTEASIIAVVYAFIVGVFIYKELPLRRVPQVVRETAPLIGMLMFVITSAILLGFLVASLQIPLKISEAILSAHMPVWMFLLLVNVILFFAGDFMDAVPIIAIFVPILFPAARALGIDPVHFGIVVIVNLEMGTITPPVGLNLYVASGITKVPVYTVLRCVLPWMLAVIVSLLVVTYFPPLSTFLPDLLWAK
ncbi:MAG: TRAP transporter large permease subunit [Candidatus Rokubacteria bacterium]|nr:TRAP transporter large permease subunit [Candidatus Rokubacteria bacterium]